MKPLILCILDGVGVAPGSPHNAVAVAKMPFYKGLFEKYPHALLDASGAAVGLPAGTMGNSEVGHITMGAGRVVNQFLRRFEMARDSGAIASSLAVESLAKTGVVHIIGLMSDGDVHASLDDTIYMANLFINRGAKVWLHFIADGRDTPPESAGIYIDKLMESIAGAGFATLSGRYYAMDRNNNLDRTRLAFEAIAGAAAPRQPDIKAALAAAYAAGETDEFIKPAVVGDFAGIQPGEGIFIANYRADRARQLVAMLSEKLPAGHIGHILTMTSLGPDLDACCSQLLPAQETRNTLGDVLAANGKTQLRIAETEKYNHITYFFDAERKIQYAGEETILVPSPAVATYDLKPEMSAPELTDETISRMKDFDVVVLNYANGDMVGHSGKMPAAVAAMEALDGCLARLVPAALALGGAVMITADHGNAEEMTDGDGKPKTAHTSNPVPFILVEQLPPCGGEDEKENMTKCHVFPSEQNPRIFDSVDSSNGGLAAGGGTKGLSSIAPTILKLLSIPQPEEMTGESLI
ncbi:MAG: 2,3-bisphosphoglycerate-independent phosphoglycerate mutase [Rickettsiales bacterium]|jgi:2,3-bisphosphoglycerate-independent phosphoglycerate mutase|nr:2,3-bisphosphoglycerate-independent phosphoglycerate mutase [Rickettsiales bacterium]